MTKTDEYWDKTKKQNKTKQKNQETKSVTLELGQEWRPEKGLPLR